MKIQIDENETRNFGTIKSESIICNLFGMRRRAKYINVKHKHHSVQAFSLLVHQIIWVKQNIYICKLNPLGWYILTAADIDSRSFHFTFTCNWFGWRAQHGWRRCAHKIESRRT